MTCKSFSRKKRTLTLMYIKENVSFYNPFAPWEPTFMGTNILGFWIPRRGCPIAGTEFQSFSVELGFWIPIVSGIP